jgi:hypothetical protein
VRLDHKVYQDKKGGHFGTCPGGCPRRSSIQYVINPGDHNGGETPVPIPNTEVKPARADGTARAAEWESRSLPGFFLSQAGRPREGAAGRDMAVRRAARGTGRWQGSN